MKGFIELKEEIAKVIEKEEEKLSSLTVEINLLQNNYRFGTYSIDSKVCTRKQAIVLVGILNERIKAAEDCRFEKERREYLEMNVNFLKTQNLRHKINCVKTNLDDWKDMEKECLELMTFEEKRQMFSEVVERCLED